MSKQRAKQAEEQAMEPRAKQKKTPGKASATHTAQNLAMKRLALALCLLGLGGVSACSSPEEGKPLGIEISQSRTMLTPMPGERSATLTVTLVGFANEADVSRTSVSIKPVHVKGVSVVPLAPERTERSLVFGFRVEYDFGEALGEAPLLLDFALENLPKGYEYVGLFPPCLVEVVDGLEKARPIPLHQGNIGVFNHYANTPEGLRRHYRLTENVHLAPPEAGQSNWTPIGTFEAYIHLEFAGSFDGDGHSLSGLVMDAPDAGFQGMFGAIGPGAEIKNLGLKDVRIVGNWSVGGLVGRNEGEVHNSHATGSVEGSLYTGGLVGLNIGTVHNSHATGSVEGRMYAGGLVGRNNGKVHNSHATGSVMGTAWYVGGLAGESNGEVHNSYATGSVEGDNEVGGLVGRSSGEVHNSYATGSVKGNNEVGGLLGGSSSKVHNSYATGSVTGLNDVGGLLGINWGTVQNSYAAGSVTGERMVGGLVGINGDGSIQNSAALSPRVLATGAEVGRVAGLNNERRAVLSDNRARDTMVLRHNNGASYEPTASTALHDQKDGAVTTLFRQQSFWTVVLRWDLSTSGAWEWKTGYLPILRGVGGTQTPVVQ